MHGFLPGSVHKLRRARKNVKTRERHLWMFSGDIIFIYSLLLVAV
jgi:hypothetical protein